MHRSYTYPVRCDSCKPLQSGNSFTVVLKGRYHAAKNEPTRCRAHAPMPVNRTRHPPPGSQRSVFHCRHQYGTTLSDWVWIVARQIPNHPMIQSCSLGHKGLTMEQHNAISTSLKQDAAGYGYVAPQLRKSRDGSDGA